MKSIRRDIDEGCEEGNEDRNGDFNKGKTCTAFHGRILRRRAEITTNSKRWQVKSGSQETKRRSAGRRVDAGACNPERPEAFVMNPERQSAAKALIAVRSHSTSFLVSKLINFFPATCTQFTARE